jgi:transcriptional regulator with XRE-family HTH domain
MTKKELRESLAEYVRRIRTEKKLSLTDVERLSRKQITNGYVSRIENGFVPKVSLPKLRALARGLGVDEKELIAIAGGDAPESEDDFLKAAFDDAYRAYQNATGEEKKFIKEVLDMITERSRKKVG